MSKPQVPGVRGIKNRLSSSIRSTFKRPPPLNEDDFNQPFVTASITVQLSPGHLRSPRIVISPLPSANSSKYSERSAAISPSPRSWAEQLASPRPLSGNRDKKFDQVQRASKLPADVPTATFGSMFFANSDSSASDSDDSTAEANIKSKRRSVRIAKLPNSPIPRAHSQQEIEKALSFLPYPLSPNPRPRINKAGIRPNAKRSTRLVEDPSLAALTTKTTTARLKLTIPSTKSAVPGIPHVKLHKKNLLSPVPELPTSPVLASEISSGDYASDSTTSTLRSAFWRSISVQKGSSSSDESNGSFESLPVPQSPFPIFLFGKSDASLPRKGSMLPSPSADANMPFPFTPRTTTSAAKNFEMMLSPAPNDAIASFSSLGSALEYLGAEGMIFTKVESTQQL
jgi:hypothetical protein